MIRWPPSHSFTFKFLASWFQIRSVLLFDTNCWNVRNVSTTPVFIKARRKSFVSTIMANEDYNIPGARKRSSLLKPWIGNMREGGEGREIDREGERETVSERPEGFFAGDELCYTTNRYTAIHSLAPRNPRPPFRTALNALYLCSFCRLVHFSFWA